VGTSTFSKRLAMIAVDARIKSSSKELPLILAVDDSPVQLRLVQDLLERNGYAVRTAPSSEEALAVLDVIAPALTILDVTMPGMSGVDLCRQLKQDKKLRNIPVILVTGERQPKDFKAGQEAGAVIYMTKPIRPERLLNAVRMLCPLPQR
jgi:CheY-like chemotaxis protein